MQAFRLLIAALMAVVFATTAQAATSKLKNNLRVTGNVTVDGTTTHTGAVTNTGNMTVGGTLGVTGVITGNAANVLQHANTGLKVLDTGGDHTITIAPSSNEAAARTVSLPTLGGAVTLAQITQAQTFAGVQTFSAQPVFSIPLIASNLNNSVKRQVQTVRLSPETGVAADGTVYRGLISFARAGTVTAIHYGTGVDPVSGTNVIAVEKNGFSGNTMLNAASVTLNGAVAGVSNAATLTAVGADLALVAGDTIACEYNAGTQGTDAANVFVTVEFAPTDF